MEYKVFMRKMKFKLLWILIFIVFEFFLELVWISWYCWLFKFISLFVFFERIILWSGDVFLFILFVVNLFFWIIELVVVGMSGGESIIIL